MKSTNPPSKYIHAIFLLSFILSFVLSFAAGLYAGDFRVIALNSRRAVIVSDDSGENWNECSKNLPPAVIPEKIVADPCNNIFLITARSGLFKFDSKTGRWLGMNSAELISPLMNGQARDCRRISAFAVKEDEPDKIALSTRHSIYMSDASSQMYKKLYDKDSGYYITALAFGKGAGELYAGTSGDGLFKISNGRLVGCSKGLPCEPHSGGMVFYEEISHIISDTKTIYLGMNFGGGIIASSDRGASWSDLKIPLKKELLYDIFDMKLRKNYLYVSSSAGIYRYHIESSAWSRLDYDSLIEEVSGNPDNLSFLVIDDSDKYPPLFYKIRDPRIKKFKDVAHAASGKKAIYTSAPSVGKKLNEHVAFIKANGFNSVVIDLKDDFGDLCFSSKNKTANEMGAVKRYLNVNRVIKAFKKEDIYVIARLVVFKDERLYCAYDNKYAIWDWKNGSPWKGNPREFWVDPYSEFVRSYNIDIAVELQDLGFDEIQFDYIRFPSDGPVDRCLYRYKENSALYKSEILCRFLSDAKERLDVPVSADVYGYNAWYRLGSQIGQDVREFAEIVDVVCPMNYPSHFGRLFYNNGNDLDRAYRIIYDGGRRSKKITGENAVIRPYLQAFNLLSPSWGPEYINSQITGAEKSGCGGYTFWNSRGDYSMVGRARSASSEKK